MADIIHSLHVALALSHDDVALARGLRALGHEVSAAMTQDDLQTLLRSRHCDVVISDWDPRKGGPLHATLGEALEARTLDVVAAAAGEATVADAVVAFQSGASDFLAAPLVVEQVDAALQRIIARRLAERQVAAARLQLRQPAAFIGSTAVTQALLSRTQVLAGSAAPVLILGESGTGKELIARQLHLGGKRAAKPLITINCAAFPDTLIEAELFGYARGAFTGATRAREGRFKAADGGTLFLDEVGELPLAAQAKLLRVLQDGTFEPLGTNVVQRVNVRVVSATHRDLKRLIREGRFREDLYYRLKVLTLRIPALRDRRADIPELVNHFIAKLTTDDSIVGLSHAAWAVIDAYPFPGNVRELEHAIHHGVVLASAGLIQRAHLPEDLLEAVPEQTAQSPQVAPETTSISVRLPLAAAMKRFERGYLVEALKAHDGNRTATAKALGISRKNLWEKLRAHGVGGCADGETAS